MRMCHIIICGLSGSKHISTLSHKWHNLKKKLLSLKYVFWFSWQLLSETFLILRRTEWDMIKNAYWSSYKNAHYSCHILMKPEISWQIFEHCSNIQFHENLPSGIRVVPHWQTDMMKLIAPKINILGKYCKFRRRFRTDCW